MSLVDRQRQLFGTLQLAVECDIHLTNMTVANATYLYPNYAARLSVITRVHRNVESPFDEDALHAVSWSAVLVAVGETSRTVLVEAATPKCPMIGKLRVDYHAGCQLGSRQGAIDALLLKTEMMIDEKMKEDEVGFPTRRNTVPPTESRKQSATSTMANAGMTTRQPSIPPVLAGFSGRKESSIAPSQRSSRAYFDSKPTQPAIGVNRRASIGALTGGPVGPFWIDEGGETGIGS